MYSEWKLTDQEIASLNERGGDINQAQEAKKQAFRKAGGIILNPDALSDLYEALKAWGESREAAGGVVPWHVKQALAKAES